MKKLVILFGAIICTQQLIAQVPYNSAVPNGYTKKAVVSEQVGLTQISIYYHRPAVKGREGKIWGGIVHKGFVDQGFGKGISAPWRAGANETTIIDFDNDIKVEGKAIAKGKYGFFIAYDSLESIVIFSKKTDSWGSFFYDPNDDVLRVAVRPKPLEKSVEYLKYEFLDQTTSSAVITLSWENLMIPFKVEVDYLKQQFEALVAESQNPRGFTSQSLNLAANWCLQNNYQLEKALEWATLAGGSKFPGDPTSFSAMNTKAAILDKLGKTEESLTVIRSAMGFGNMNQLQQLGRQLITAKKPQAALEVFLFSYNRDPDQFGALVGLARGYSANGDYAKALEYVTTALPLAPNEANKRAVQSFIDKLKAGKDINQQ